MISSTFDYTYLYTTKLVLETFGGSVIPILTLDTLIADVENELARNQHSNEYGQIILLNRIWFLKTSRVLIKYPDPDEELCSLYEDFTENFGLLAEYLKCVVSDDPQKAEYLAHAQGIRDAYKAVAQEAEGNVKLLVTYLESEADYLINRYETTLF